MKHNALIRALTGLVLAAVAGQLAGCSRLQALWSDEPDPVPVTPPETVNEQLAGPVIEPEPADAEPARPVEPAEPAEPADVGDTGSDPGELAADPADSVSADANETMTVIGLESSDPNEGPERVVAASLLRIRGQFVTTDDVVLAAGPQLAELPDDLPDRAFRVRAAEILQEEIRRQVNQLTVLGEVEKTMNDHQRQFVDQQVEDYLQRLIDEHGRSRQQLEKDMRDDGTTLRTVLDNYRRELLLRIYWQSKLQGAIVINRRDLWNYYQKHLDDYSTPKKVRMQLIALPVSDFAGEDGDGPAQRALAKGKAHEAARQALRRIEDGEDFARVAGEVSRGVMADDGGLWPLMESGNFAIRTVEQVAFSLDEGQVSELIETDRGYYVVKASEVVGGTVTPFEQAQEQIERTLREQRERELIEKFMSRAYLKTPVIHTERFLELAVDEAVRRFRGEG